jgi:hypothetical protein
MEKVPNWSLTPRPGKDVEINFLILKFHLPAHIQQCHVEYAFNYIRGCARTDGESVERKWFQSNSESTGTKEMGPGGRHDTLDDTFDQANYKKCISMGKCNFHLITLYF